LFWTDSLQLVAFMA